MSEKRPIPLLGRIALHLKLITLDQLAEATRSQARDGGEHSLGTVLVEKGFIDEAQLQQILKAREQVVAKHRAAQAAQATQTAAPGPEPGAATAKVQAAEPARSAPPAQPPAPAPSAAPAQPTAAPSAAPAAAKPARPPAKAAAPQGDRAGLEAVLRIGVERGASDVHIHAGMPLRLRQHGRFEAVDDTPIPPERSEALVRGAMTPEQAQVFDEHGELDLALGIEGLGRFRVNLFRQQRGMDGVFRVIPPRPPGLEELGLPTALAKFTNFHQGLVLITGPANCGKSATLAALVDIINEERREHILTVEDPIEVLHPSRRCLVNQRTVGPHTRSFARALRAALREDPDVIVIGELRDLETISLALTAAETGHLVLGTLHTNSTIRTVNRLVGVFPADQQDQIRNMVSESLRAVVSQRLVPKADGSGRLPALEILVNNKAVGNLIRENKTFQIQSMLQTGASQGMCLLDDSLNRLVQAGEIDREEALRQASDPKRFRGAD